MVNQSLAEGREESPMTRKNECWPDSNVRKVREDEQAEKTTASRRRQSDGGSACLDTRDDRLRGHGALKKDCSCSCSKIH